MSLYNYTGSPPGEGGGELVYWFDWATIFLQCAHAQSPNAIIKLPMSCYILTIDLQMLQRMWLFLANHEGEDLGGVGVGN